LCNHDENESTQFGGDKKGEPQLQKKRGDKLYYFGGKI